MFDATSQADVVLLKNGKQLEGNVEARTDQEVRVRVSGGTVTFRSSEIASIEERPLTMQEPAPAPSKSVSSKSATQPTQTKQGRLSQARDADERRTEQIAHEITDQIKARIHQLPAEWQGLALGASSLSLLAGLVLFLVFQVWCIYRVAVKTGTGHAWFAWLLLVPVPLAHIFPFSLILWMGGRSAWWLLLYIVGGVAGCLISTFVGGLIALMKTLQVLVLLGVVFVAGFVGPGIAYRCGKSGWWGPGLFIPPVSLLVWPYLALSPSKSGPSSEADDKRRMGLPVQSSST
jgi:hypothetical protein